MFALKNRVQRLVPRHDRSLTLGPIGMEFSRERLNVVQLERGPGSLRARALRSVPYDHTLDDLVRRDVDLSRLVRSALAGPFRGRDVVTAMPAMLTRLMAVNYQVQSGQTDESAIYRLITERVGNVISEFVVDYLPLRGTAGKSTTDRSALVAMCREETAISFLERLRRCGLNVLSLEIGPVAIKRLIVALQSPGDGADVLVANTGRNKSYLTLISDGALVSDDEIEFGEDQIIDSVCQTLDLPEHLARRVIAEADFGGDDLGSDNDVLIEIIRPQLNRLAREIRRGLMFVAADTRAGKETAVYLLGGLARWRGAEVLLSRMLGNRVRTVPDPLASFNPEAGSADGQPHMAVAAGLALKGLVDA